MKIAVLSLLERQNLRRQLAAILGSLGWPGLLLLFASCVDPAATRCDEAEAAAEARPQRQGSIALAADPNGLFWQAGRKTLYIADDDGNQILGWTEQDGVRPLAQLPPAPAAGPGLGQVVVTANGTLVVPRFGHGTAGDVAFGPIAGPLATVPGLAPERRRIGLAQADDGTLYGTYFLKVGSGRAGAVTMLSLTGGESEVISGLRKPVGVLVVSDQIFVSDQDAGQILQAPLSLPSTSRVFAALPGPDLLAAGPAGSLFTGGPQGVVRQIAAGGQVTTLAVAKKEVRGLAFDAVGARLFVALHDSDAADGIQHSVEILPIGEQPTPACPAPR